MESLLHEKVTAKQVRLGQQLPSVSFLIESKVINRSYDIKEPNRKVKN
jgi:hypothetical protein